MHGFSHADIAVASATASSISSSCLLLRKLAKDTYQFRGVFSSFRKLSLKTDLVKNRSRRASLLSYSFVTWPQAYKQTGDGRPSLPKEGEAAHPHV